eukprot:TRINITY_DN7465_c0_g4_i1.p1 TRINITY_DN7465_c0_g4~~TRINITY_DN7465_c0_g4_i1.p1  ORF type:complete len:433 (-),score=109.06 TRINITY_DN7465_c0_g4_i1:87-1385(-)
MLGWLNKGPQTLPECPEPKTKEEYEALANQTLKRVLDLIDGDGWDEVPITKRSDATNDDTRLFCKQPTDPSEGSSHLLKTTGTIACSPSALYRAITSGDVQERQKWEKDLLELRVVEDVSKDIQVIYTAFRAPSPVASREFVAIKCQTKKDGRIISYGTSINHPACGLHPVYVRAVATSAFIISPVPGDSHRTHCVRFAQVDPKGMIPGFVINLSKQKAAAAFSVLRKAIEEKRIPVIEDTEEEEEQEQEEKENIPVKQPSQPTKTSSASTADVVVAFAPSTATTEVQIQREKEIAIMTTVVQRAPSKIDREEDWSEDELEDDEVFWECSSETPRRRRSRRGGGGLLTASSLEATLKSLQETTDRIERQSQLITQRLTTLEAKLQSSQHKPELDEGLISLTNLSWSSLAFLVAWPVVSYVAIDYFSKANKKR